jgi:hypothetical protein
MREKNPVAKRLPHELVSHAVSRTHGISFGSRARRYSRRVRRARGVRALPECPSQKNPVAPGSEHKLRGGNSVRPIRADDHDIGIRSLPLRSGQYGFPIRLEFEVRTRQFVKIAMRRIIRDVVLEKYDRGAAPAVRAAKPAPDRGVTIVPRRADRQAENDQLHRALAKRAATLLLP